MDALDYLLPTPKWVVRFPSGHVAIDGFRVEEHPVEGEVGASAVELLNAIPGGYPVIFEFASLEFDVPDPAHRGEGYIIEIAENRALIKAETEAGFFYGAVTLSKLFDGKQLPLCGIVDWPGDVVTE